VLNRRFGAVALGLVLVTAACNTAVSSPSQPATSPAGAPSSAPASVTPTTAAPGEVEIVYSSAYLFNNDADGTGWWNGIKSQFETAFPGSTLKLTGIDGTDVDMMNAAALQYRSASTTPDLLMMPTGYVGQWVGSDYLIPLDDQLAATTFWADFPQSIKDEYTVDGKVYAVSTGENNSALFYNKEMLTKAGITMPWEPKTWQDVVDAARKVKAANPGIVPIWLPAGFTAGPPGISQGAANLVYASKTPTILDDASQKWVVDSPGLREIFELYRTVYGEGLGASTSDLFVPNAVGRPATMLFEKKLAIAVGSNWFAGAWNEPNRFWPEAKDQAAAVLLPTSDGQAPGSASTMAGWAVAVSKASERQDLAWEVVKIIQDAKNLVFFDNKVGLVPANSKVANSPEVLDYTPPFSKTFADALVNSRPMPSSGEFPVWAQGFGEALGSIASDPNTTVDAAIKSLTDAVKNQLGDTKTVVLQ